MATRTEPSTDGLATVNQAAEYLSVCRDTVYSLMDRGVLKNTHIGRARRVCWESLKQLKATGVRTTSQA